MKRLLRIFLVIIIILGLITVTISVLFNYYFADKLTTLLKDEVNKKLLCKVDFKDLNISIIRKFPNITVNINNVTASNPKGFEKFKQNPYLFHFDNLLLRINLMDFVKHEYIIKRIDAIDGQINVLINSDGKPNYDIFKPANDSLEDSLKINLKNIRLNQTDIIFKNPLKQIVFDAHTGKLSIDALFVDDLILSTIKGDVFINLFSYDAINYIRKSGLSINLNLKTDSKKFEINVGDIKLAGLEFGVRGLISLLDDNSIDLKINGKNLDLISFLSLVPPGYREEIKDLTGTGIFHFNIFIFGKISTTISPDIKIFFGVRNGSVFNKRTGFSISKLNAEGIFSNGPEHTSSSSYIQLKKFSGDIQNSHFEGNYQLINFNSPEMQIDGNFKLIMDELSGYLKIPRVDYIKGEILTSLDMKIHFKKFSDSIDYIQSIDAKGIARINNVDIKIKDLPFSINRINGEVKIDDKLVTDKLFLRINDNDFILSGILKNSLEELITKSPVYQIEGKVFSPKLVLSKNELLIAPANQDSAVTFSLPKSISLHLDFSSDSFRYEQFKASNVKFICDYHYPVFSIKSMNCLSMDGTFQASGSFKKDTLNKYVLAVESGFQNVDIYKLFYSFNNFRQHEISYENLNGDATGEIRMVAELNNKFEIDLDKMKAESEITIENGELNDFEPMQNLSRFIKASELEKISFSSFSNSFYIVDGSFQFPQMEINSTAFNLKASGIYYFNNNFSYQVRVSFAELMSNKLKKRKAENAEFEDIKHRRMNIPLIITGNTNDYKISYDRRVATKMFKEEFSANQDKVKEALNNQLDQMAPDSSLINTDEPKSFQLDWDETNPDVDSQAPVNKKKNKEKIKSKGFKIRFEDDSSNTSPTK